MNLGLLTPLQMIAGAGLLQNQGISVSPALQTSITAYSNTPVMSAFLSALAVDPSIATLGANTCPALSDSVPTAYAAIGNTMTTTISAQAFADFGGGDISKFIQAFNLAEAYCQTTNLFIDSAINSQTYMGTTFTNMNNMTTGDITAVNLATDPFAEDMAKLGNLIDLDDLGNLGSPLALVQRISTVAGNVPILAVFFIAEGIPQEIVINFNNPAISVTDSIQKTMYNAMLKVTGTALDQVLAVLKITTVGIESMADLLNPVKIFPNSYQSLTAPTATGPRAIYINNVGTVNSALSTELPLYVLSSLA